MVEKYFTLKYELMVAYLVISAKGGVLDENRVNFGRSLWGSSFA